MAKKESRFNPAAGFDVNSFAKTVSKLGKDFQRKSKPVNQSGIQSEDQRSSNNYVARAAYTNSKPKDMTYGGSKANKGTTIYKKRVSK